MSNVNIPTANTDPARRMNDDPPPFILGLQSQFAHLQLVQSRVCKEKAEESIRQVQDSQEKQRASRIYAAEAQRLLEKAKREGSVDMKDVNKQLEAFCKAHNIPFTKIDIQKGTAPVWQLLGWAVLGWGSVGIGVLLATCSLLPIAAAAGVALAGGVLALSLIAEIFGGKTNNKDKLPNAVQPTLDALLALLPPLKDLFNLGNGMSAQERKEGMQGIVDEFKTNPLLSRANLEALVDASARAGIFDPENVRRAAAEAGVDLNTLEKDMSAAAKELARFDPAELLALPETRDLVDQVQTGVAGFGNTAPDPKNEPWKIEIAEAFVRLLLFPVAWLKLMSPDSDLVKKLFTKTTIAQVCDADNWKTVMNALEALNTQEAGRSQLLMVTINNQIGQYNSYIQGAMTAIAAANQVNTALAKGTG